MIQCIDGMAMLKLYPFSLNELYNSGKVLHNFTYLHYLGMHFSYGREANNPEVQRQLPVYWV
jgi:hypothetical protein